MATTYKDCAITKVLEEMNTVTLLLPHYLVLSAGRVLRGPSTTFNFYSYISIYQFRIIILKAHRKAAEKRVVNLYFFAGW